MNMGPLNYRSSAVPESDQTLTANILNCLKNDQFNGHRVSLFTRKYSTSIGCLNQGNQYEGFVKSTRAYTQNKTSLMGKTKKIKLKYVINEALSVTKIINLKNLYYSFKRSCTSCKIFLS